MKIPEQVLQKLKESGITPKQAQELGFKFLSPKQSKELFQGSRAEYSIVMPYIDPWTGKPMRFHGVESDFYRVRYLGGGPKTLNDAVSKVAKYLQPPNSGVCAYFPPLKSIKWPEVLSNPSLPLDITEGELKADKACIEGFLTMALGGVHSFRSKKHKIAFLPELEKINWTGRLVRIIYDSDLYENQNVQRALLELSEALYLRGGTPEVVLLRAPDGYDGKLGVDDYLVRYGKKAYYDMLCNNTQPISMAHQLRRLNDKYIYIQESMGVYSAEIKKLYRVQDFISHVTTDKVPHFSFGKNGEIKYEYVPAAKEWIQWPLRRSARNLVYRPGVTKEHDNEVNIWPGWGVEPKKGDAGPFLRLVDYLFTNSAKGDKDWFIKWLAFPLQYPGAKLFTSVVMQGVRHGTGKSFLGYIMGNIYGKNFVELNQVDLHKDFNGWAENVQFALGDDITGSNKRADADRLKKMITQKRIRVNKKFEAEYVIDDCINYYFTTNQPDAFFLEDDDRRFFVHEVQVGPLDSEFYAELDLWNSSGGPAALFWYLLNKVDVTDFNPSARARTTRAKELMQLDGLSDLGSFVRLILNDPEAALRLHGKPLTQDIFSSQQLLAIYQARHSAGAEKLTANGVGRECRRAQIPMAYKGAPLPSPQGQSRFFICRNADKWLKASRIDIVKHLQLNMAVKEKF